MFTPYTSAYCETPGCLSTCCGDHPPSRWHSNLVPPNCQTVPGASLAWRDHLDGIVEDLKVGVEDKECTLCILHLYISWFTTTMRLVAQTNFDRELKQKSPSSLIDGFSNHLFCPFLWSDSRSIWSYICLAFVKFYYLKHIFAPLSRMAKDNSFCAS